MSQITKSILLLSILAGNMLMSFADRGIGKRSKAKISLNIPLNSSMKNALSFNLKAGLKYTGSLISEVTRENDVIISNTIVTYQKGNNIYIVPYKQRILIPEMKQGYTGMKLVIKTN